MDQGQQLLANHSTPSATSLLESVRNSFGAEIGEGKNHFCELAGRCFTTPSPHGVGLGRVQPNKPRGHLLGGPNSGKQPGGGATARLVHFSHLPVKQGHVKSNRPGGQLQEGGPRTGKEARGQRLSEGPMTWGAHLPRPGNCHVTTSIGQDPGGTFTGKPKEQLQPGRTP